MNIYYARSIRGDHAASDHYPVIEKAIKAFGHTPALELTVLQSLSQSLSNNAYIYQRDIDWIQRCQGMIAEVSNPSLGVGYEIAYAEFVAHIPVLCVAVNGAHVSAMIAGSRTMAFYHNVDELDDIVREWLIDFEKVSK